MVWATKNGIDSWLDGLIGSDWLSDDVLELIRTGIFSCSCVYLIGTHMDFKQKWGFSKRFLVIFALVDGTVKYRVTTIGFWWLTIQFLFKRFWSLLDIKVLNSSYDITRYSLPKS